MDHFVHRYRHANEVLRDTRTQLKRFKQSGTDTERANAERCVKAAEENRDGLDMFKKDVTRYIRFYEFVSQITPFESYDLEQLNVYCRHLLPLLRQEVIEEDEIDLSAVVMSHYNLREKRTQDLKLKDGEGKYLTGITGLGTGKPKEPEKDLLSQILEKMNELFRTETTDGDKLNWMQGMASKLTENENVMDQIRHNPDDNAVMNGDFPKAMDAAVIERMDVQQEYSMEYLSKPEVAKEIQVMMLELLRRQLFGGPDQRF